MKSSPNRTRRIERLMNASFDNETAENTVISRPRCGSILGFRPEDKVRNRLIVAFLMVACASAALLAQNPQRGQQTPAGPAPRWPDGRVNLGAPIGQRASGKATGASSSIRKAMNRVRLSM